MTASEIKRHAAGLNGPDGWYHREKLETRLTVLREDGPTIYEQLEASVIEACFGSSL